jgi:hypothetical protein
LLPSQRYPTSYRNANNNYLKKAIRNNRVAFCFSETPFLRAEGEAKMVSRHESEVRAIRDMRLDYYFLKKAQVFEIRL